jgi:hypothetical protein
MSRKDYGTQERADGMFTPRAKLRVAGAATATVVAVIALGAGASNAAGRPLLQEGAYLYSGTTGTGTAAKADLGDFGTCHTLRQPARSVQIASGSASLEL